jgi:membrane-bound serine protease (ClpP class)
MSAQTKRQRWLIRALWLAALILAAHLATRPAEAQTQPSREIIILEATGPVIPPFASYLQRGIDTADSRNAEAVVVMLDTPGGHVDTTMDIVQAFRTSDVPVVVYVGPPGAGAASAGLLITLAGHVAAMAPNTAIGASSPIDASGADLESTADLKAKEFLSAEARSLAEGRGDAAIELVNAAVYEARAVSAQEALDAGLIDLVARDLDTLLAEIDGMPVEVNGRTRSLETTGAQLTRLPMNPLEQVLLIITHPNLVFVFLTLGVMLLIVEAWSPGGWVAGAAGTVLLGLSLYGMGVLPVNWLGIVFVILAVVLFILEINAPTHGILTLAGAASLGIGAVVLFSQPELAPFGQLSIPLVVGQSLLISVVFFFLAMFALRAQKRPPATGTHALIGRTGRVTQDLSPHGMVQVWGERWRAETVDGQAVPAGTEVEVVDISEMRLRVRPK